MGLGFVVNIDHAGLSWGEFQSRLLQVLLLLRERELVVITTKRPYPDIAVQFMYMESGILLCEFPGNEVLAPEARLDEAGLDVMRSFGYRAPRVASECYWEMAVELPVSTAVLERVATGFMTYLRDLHGVSSPEFLMYRSWRDREVPERGVFYTDEELEELDPGEYPLKQDLGIDMEPDL